MTRTPAREGQDQRIQILGMPVDVVTMDGCLARIAEFVESGRPHLIVTADSSGIVQAQTDTALAELYHTADLVTPDSAGVVWAMKRGGSPVPARVSGVDIVDRACRESADRGWRVYFLGAAPGVAEEAAERMRLRHPGCNIIGARHGYFPPESDPVVAAEVAETKPDLLFVAMGIPRQEKFIRATESIIGAKVAMGVGGTFDVFSGRVKRAPKFLQKIKMEWAWRLAQNPKKIGKVMLLPKFVSLILRERR
jgi:N-acetylglucosaminyldiphosphoundecaprenol N-acetyl-beta-D-mannosaminyltransferase